MKRADIDNICRSYGLAPNKKLGQNFLVDNNVIDKLLRLVGAGPEDRLLEIGPGLGAMTGGLADAAEKLTVVEIDAGFCRYLEDFLKGKNATRIVHGDFCRLDLEPFRGKVTRAVSNLPYYCASDILFRIATEIMPPDIYVMMQKEMGERLAASPGEKSYGAMTVSLGYYYAIKETIVVNSEAFYPRPDVASLFLHLEARENRNLGAVDLKAFHNLIRSAFWGRRKTILKSLSDSPHMSLTRETVRELLTTCGIDEKKRGEELHLDQYVLMAGTLGKMKG